MNSRLIAYLLALIIGLSACHTGKKITATPRVEKKLDNIAQLQKALDSAKLHYKWLKYNTSISIQQDDNKLPTASSTFKLRQDSLLWNTVNVFIEFARTRVNTDSAIVLNRTEKSYSVLTFKQLQQMLAIEGLSLHAMQNLLLARPPFDIHRDAKFFNMDKSFVLTYTGPTYKESIQLDKATLVMTEYRYERNATEFIDIVYSDFKEVNGQIMPHKIKAEAHTPNKLLLNLTVNEYNFLNKDEAPFTIPASYSRED